MSRVGQDGERKHGFVDIDESPFSRATEKQETARGRFHARNPKATEQIQVSQERKKKFGSRKRFSKT